MNHSNFPPGYTFRDASLLSQALTHRSAGAPHNERLEFLGDALVGQMVAEVLYVRWPKADEGALTRARSEIVRESSLAAIARQMDLGQQIQFGPGELKAGGHRRDSILSDTLEALIAAIYLDAGFETCRKAVLPWFSNAIEALPSPNRLGKDAKTRLQEWLQARQLPLPIYALLSETGEDHAKSFVVTCTLTDPFVNTQGSASSRRAAEQSAADAAMLQIAKL